MKIDRELLLKTLCEVSPGLSKGGVIEQSDSFTFRDGKVTTFNDEVFCSAKFDLGIEGTVFAKPLVDLLRKMSEKEVDISEDSGHFLVKGKRRKAGILMEEPLSLFEMEEPGEWKKLPDRFAEAVSIVGQCAGKDESKFLLTCIHVTADRLEASDNFQAIKFPVDTGLDRDMLIRRDVAKHLMGMRATEWGESENWLIFRRGEMVMGVRRWLDDYPDLSRLWEGTGVKVTLPTAIADAVDRAEIFSAEKGEDQDDVSISLSKERMELSGEGMSGWYRELLQSDYDGEPFSFSISPGLLLHVADKSSKCELLDGMVKVSGDPWTYVASTFAED
ncbi:MAG: hypothetical protein ACXQTR_01080 [Candidatus Methanospirareceae archaeon]